MGLTIDNETNWNGRHLRVLCRRVIDATDGHRNRTVEIKTSRARNKEGKWRRARGDESCSVGTAMNMYRGRASLGSRRKLYMGLPMVEREIDGEWLRHEFDPVQFARVLEHEILHNQGLRHGEMVDDTRYCRQDVSHMDLDGITVEPKPSYEWEGDYE